MQNGLTAGISSHLLKGRPVSWTKLAVLVRLQCLRCLPGGRHFGSFGMWFGAVIALGLAKPPGAATVCWRVDSPCSCCGNPACLAALNAVPLLPELQIINVPLIVLGALGTTQKSDGTGTILDLKVLDVSRGYVCCGRLHHTPSW